MKLNKKTAGALIFILLVLLLFFSRTIYTYNMPQVTGTKPSRGTLNKLEISSGIARWAETENIYAASSGAAGKVYVREGERVEEGQILFEMDFNVPAAQRRLSEIDNNISKLEADIRSLFSRLNNILQALSSEGGKNTEYSSAGSELIIMEISRANIALADAQLSFSYGMLSRNELINAENNIKALLYKYESEIHDIEHTIALKQIDLDSLRLARETTAETLRDYINNTVIRAPCAGVILDIYAERGKYFNENTLLVSIGTGSGFIVECNISLDNNFINPGDTCQLVNSNGALNGIVGRIRPSANGKTVTISITSDDVSDGETFDITFEKGSTASFTLVPNRAINQDNDGYFLYQIKRRSGIMGQEYYLERLNIYIGDSDHQNTAVIRGITFFEPIVLVSDKSLEAGMTVTLKNAEDFFEN